MIALVIESDYDYAHDDADEYYDYYNDELPETFEKIPDYRMTTSSPKWVTKNSSALSKFNLKTLFDFVEIILRPTNPNENTVECAEKLRQSLINEENTLASPTEDVFWENDLETTTQEM